MPVISKAQSRGSIGRSDCSVEVKVDVEGVAFCDVALIMALGPFRGLLLKKLGIRLEEAASELQRVVMVVRIQKESLCFQMPFGVRNKWRYWRHTTTTSM